MSREPNPEPSPATRALALAEAGHGLVQLKKWDGAIALFREALSLGPGMAPAWGSLAYACEMAGRADEAVEAYVKASSLDSACVPVAFNLGNVLRKQGRLDEAGSAYRRVLAIDPGHTQAWNNLGLVLHMQGRPDEAIACYGRALEVNPSYADALNNLGSAHVAKNEVPAALEAYGRALAIDPGMDRTRFNVGVALLLGGDLGRGWSGYEFRVRPPWLESLSGEPWRGDTSIEGKTILVTYEQGLGDTIHFARYAEPVASLGARVLLQVQPTLKRLLATVPGVTSAVGAGEPLPAHDTHCSMMSLPHVLGTTLASVPARVPYVEAPKQLAAAWRARLRGGSQRVGIAWSGNPGHHLDRWRSIPLALLLSAAEGIPVELVRIQKEIAAGDATTLGNARNVTDFGGEFVDFADTAALVAQLDLVISVDTSVAHLAGALGKPLWLLIPFAPDWRWMLSRSDSPWYPTARLFRQSRHGDWTNVVDSLRTALGARYGGIPGIRQGQPA